MRIFHSRSSFPRAPVQCRSGDRPAGRFPFPGHGLPVLAILTLLLAACRDSGTGPALEVVIESPAQGNLVAGDQIQLNAVFSDPSATGISSWASSDTAVALVDESGFLRAQRPGTARISVQRKGSRGDLPVTVVPRPGGYTAPEIDYLQEVAFGFEFGSAPPLIRKWDRSPGIQLFGSPTAADLETLTGVLEELNLLMEEVHAEVVSSEPTVEVHFAPVSQFPTILPGYVPGNDGYFGVWFDATNRIYKAVVLLSSDQTQIARNHLIREEITQMLGLAKDSYSYPNSIFFQGWTTTQGYDPIDLALIEMLYRRDLLPGMNDRQATDLLRTMTRRGWTGPGTQAVEPPSALSIPRPRPGRPGVGFGGG